MSIYRIENGKVVLSPHKAQQEAWDSLARFIFLIAGTQSGKTTFGPWWLYREISNKGAGDYIAATASYDLFKLKMLPSLREVFEGTLGIGRYWKGSKILEIMDPASGQFRAKHADDDMYARIILRSAQSEGGLESSTALAAWLDECGQDSFGVGSWEAVLRRLALNRGRALGTTTPYNLGYLKTEIVDRALAGDADYHVIHADSTVNPMFSMEEFERARRTMPEWKFEMFYRGRLTKPPSLIYGVYVDLPREMGGHMVDDFQIPPSWPVSVGVDFGANNTGTVWVAHDQQADVFFAFHETLDGGMTTAEHCAKFNSYAEGRNLDIVFGGAPSEKQQRWDWAAHDVAVQRPMVTDVEIGIERVFSLFKTRRLFVFSSLRVTRSMLGTYSRVVDATGTVIGDTIKDKATFHLLDCLRYVAPWLIHAEVDQDAPKEAAA